MEHKSRKEHWENIYITKEAHEVSWTQDSPEASIQAILDAQLDKNASIIDVGGGESKLVDYLLDEGYEHITVLDISENALSRTKKRLGKRAKKVTWITADITQFEPSQKYDFWHDRAVFHFLTSESEVTKYLTIARTYINDNGTAFIGTFSNNGPLKCSGLEIQQYSESSLCNTFDNGFEKLTCKTEDHTTPFGTTQNFLLCTFRKKTSKQEPLPTILVLCTGNSCRSQIAEGYLKHFAGDKAIIYSAGVETHGVNPKAITTMREDGIDISHHSSNHIDEYRHITFDHIITVCDNAKERCPYFPSRARRYHYNFPDPAKATGSEEEIKERFREVREIIKEYCEMFVKETLTL